VIENIGAGKLQADAHALGDAEGFRDTHVHHKAAGPMTMPFPAFPKLPAAGGANAARLYQFETVRWPAGRLGFATTLGRMVTVGAVALVVFAVPVGSAPVHSGVRKKSCSRSVTPCIASRPGERL
jgi:hypothetical protein